MRTTDYPPDLFAPHNGTPTSQEAAERKIGAGTERAMVYASLRTQGPATREELEQRTGLTGNSLRPRCYELIRLGLVEETGETRQTTSGRKATVLRAK